MGPGTGLQGRRRVPCRSGRDDVPRRPSPRCGLRAHLARLEEPVHARAEVPPRRHRGVVELPLPPGRQHQVPGQDAPLHLGPEPGRARGRVHTLQPARGAPCHLVLGPLTPVAVLAKPVPHPVEAGEVGGRLGGRKDVVRGQGRTQLRHRHGHHLGAGVREPSRALPPQLQHRRGQLRHVALGEDAHAPPAHGGRQALGKRRAGALVPVAPPAGRGGPPAVHESPAEGRVAARRCGCLHGGAARGRLHGPGHVSAGREARPRGAHRRVVSGVRA